MSAEPQARLLSCPRCPCPTPESPAQPPLFWPYQYRTHGFVGLPPENPFFLAAFVDSVDPLATSVEDSGVPQPATSQVVIVVSPKFLLRWPSGGEQGWWGGDASSLHPTKCTTLLVSFSFLLRLLWEFSISVPSVCRRGCSLLGAGHGST